MTQINRCAYNALSLHVIRVQLLAYFRASYVTPLALKLD